MVKNKLKLVDENYDHYSIEIFQLENLINNNISFLFFNLSLDFPIKDSTDFIFSVLKLSTANTERDIKKKLKKMEKSKPVVLICEKGDRSCELAQFLQKKGFINTFFVKGGIVSLVKERG